MSQPVPISASGWNHFFDLAAAIALIALAIVIGAMIFFMVRYREQKGQPKFIPDLRFQKRSGQRKHDFCHDFHHNT